MEMPKLKSKSGAKKRFRATGTGKILHNQAYKRHGMSKRPKDMLRNSRGTTTLCASDAKIVRKLQGTGYLKNQTFSFFGPRM